MSTDSETIHKLFRELLAAAGDHPDRAGLLRTPARALDSFLELTRGLREDPALLLQDGVFDDPSSDLVMVRHIAFTSLCEHHLLPFTGWADVAYLPNGRLPGLSRIARIVEHFACRPQVQERMTAQIADFIMDAIQPQALGVRVMARHLCMTARGIRKQETEVMTMAWRRCDTCSSESWATFQATIHD